MEALLPSDTEDNDLAGDHVVVLTSLVVAALVWGCLRLAEPISRALGPTGMDIVTRLMGLILASVAVEFIIGGVALLLPGLAAMR